jgi:G:T/U-mismatch repair DNA glycosylase
MGTWDVYAIRNAVPNDIATLHQPQLQAIAHDAVEGFKHANHTRTPSVPAYQLPNTSPAKASWSFARKIAAWREVMERDGLD